MCDDKKLNALLKRVDKVETKVSEMEAKQKEWEKSVLDFFNSESYKFVKQLIKKKP